MSLYIEKSVVYIIEKILFAADKRDPFKSLFLLQYTDYPGNICENGRSSDC